MSKSSKVVEVVVGLDVSDRQSAMCVVDRSGEVIERGTLKTSEPALASHFTGRPPMRIVLEVGPHSPWISRLLQRLGHTVIIVNPYRLRLVADSLKKTDRSDAETLARIGRLDPALLGTVHHRSAGTQQALDVLHARTLLVGQRTALMNHIRGTVKANGFGPLPHATLASTFVARTASVIPAELHDALDPLLAQVALISDAIREYDRKIEAMVEQHPVASSLRQQISGVGPQSALSYVLVIEDAARFAHSRDVGAYLGLVPRQHQSGSRSPELHITKAGDRALRSLLVQCAHYIISRGPDCDLQRWAKARMGTSSSQRKKIVVAVARKLAVLLHRLWTTGEAYDPFYNHKRQQAKEPVMTAA